MYFEDILSGRKSFELRKNDRNYHVGDKLVLHEYNDGEYTGRDITVYVKYIFHGTGQFGLNPPFCILGITRKPLRKE